MMCMVARGATPFRLSFFAGQSYDIVSAWRLPNVKCSRCVLQWRYITAHMCL
jgi:hypothetical protein